jgi:hypothetical protein
MKVGKVLLVLLFAAITSYAQNKSLGVGTPTPNANAALHVESPTNNQGFIMPRLTTAQRTGLSTLLTATDNGLMLYDTNLKTIFIWDGSAWKNTAEVAGGSRLSYPYKDSVATSLTGNDLFALKYNNASTKRVLRVESLNSANAGSAVSVLQNGTGIGIFSRVDNATAGTSAIFGTTNSNLGGAVAPVGVYGESTGTGSLAASFRVNNAANTFPAVYTETNGTGPALRVNSLNSSSSAPGLQVFYSGTGNAIETGGKIQAGQFIGNGSGLTNITATNPRLTLPYQDSVLTAPAGSNLLKLYYGGTATGNVGLAYFENLNPNNAFSPIFSRTSGTGSASNFIIANSANTGAAVGATTNGTGPAVRAINTGAGNGFAGLFQNNNATNAFPAIQSSTVGTGPGLRVLQGSTSAGSGIDVNLTNTAGLGAGIVINQQGLGLTGVFNISNDANIYNAIRANTNGTGDGGYFAINNTASGAAGLYSTTNGTGAAIQGQTSTGFTAVYGRREGASNGNAGLFEITDAGNSFPALDAKTVGKGSAANFSVNNSASTLPALNVVSNSDTPAAAGSAGKFEALGLGRGLTVESNNAVNTSRALSSTHAGLGRAGHFQTTNSANSESALYVASNGTGYALQVQATGTGENALFNVNNAASSGTPVSGVTNGTGLAGFFQVNNSAAGGSAIQGVTNSNVGGANAPVGVFGLATGTGSSGGSFKVNNAASNFAALYAETNGTAMSLLVNHTGASGSPAVFQSSGINVARIDKKGQGFFNGGTQNSGADVAEMFDVEGSKSQYEPGDVLVISEANDRTVEKSSAPASTKVVGVYATKPGVVLTEKSIEESLDQLVPMGVIGVIPTKVCLENGPIKRGDLLVTSSKQGHAMKAIPVNVGGVLIYPTGAILGKALENFDGQESGLIKVLVNVK